MHYHHRFVVQAPLAVVAAFHSQSASMGAITPPPLVIRVHRAPEIMRAGDVMDFTMWFGFLPVRWVARIEEFTERRFVDRQLSGPFARWEHVHAFEPLDDDRTAVIDDVTAELSPNLLWKLVGLGMWIGLPILFAYRGWKTRRLLQHEAREPTGAG
ncbi:MAG: cyclase [Caldilineaceae bacterium]|nr:cyclase [Caldilineaceae bacterium]